MAARFDPKALSRTDWVVVGAAGVAFIALFLPWYGATSFGVSASVSGWRTSYGWIGALLIVFSGAYLALARSHADLSRVILGPATVVVGAAVIGTVLVLVRWISLPRGHAGLQGVTIVSYGPRVGIVLTLVVGIAQAVAALSLFRGSGESLPWK